MKQRSTARGTLLVLALLGLGLFGVLAAWVYTTDGRRVYENGRYIGTWVVNADFKTMVTVGVIVSALMLLAWAILTWSAEDEKESCPRCRTKIREDFVVCPRCMLPLKMRCPGCARALPAGYNACPHCGQVLPRGGPMGSVSASASDAGRSLTACPSCSNVLPSGVKFCNACGHVFPCPETANKVPVTSAPASKAEPRPAAAKPMKLKVTGFCARCSKPLPVEAKHCVFCGAENVSGQDDRERSEA